MKIIVKSTTFFVFPFILISYFKKERLAKVGIEDLNLRGTYLLLSLDSKGNLVRADNGIPEMRVCNFEFLHKIR